MWLTARTVRVETVDLALSLGGRTMKTVIITGMPGCGMRKVRDELKTTPGLFPAEMNIKIDDNDVGDKMYNIDVLGHPPPQPTREEWEEKILDGPRSALAALRKAVFETITTKRTSFEEEEYTQGEKGEPVTNNVVLVFVHATFFWRHDIQIGTPFASVEELEPDLFVTVVDDLRRIAKELYRQKRWQDLSLEEILWWRAVETTTTAAVASALKVPHYLLARDEDISTLANLIMHPPPKMHPVYASYPISLVGDEELKQSEEFIEELRKYLIVFNPLKIRDVEYGREQLFQDYDEDLAVNINEADTAALQKLRGLGPKRAQRIIAYRTANGPFQSVGDITKIDGIGKALLEKWESAMYINEPGRKFKRRELDRVRKQLDHQTVARDYDLIDQSDFIIVHYTKTTLEKLEKELQKLASKYGGPELRTDLEKVMGIIAKEQIMPLSAGVICEMQHAYTHHKPVYAVWQSPKEPSPFFVFYCTAWRRTKEALLSFLRDEGIIAD